MKLLLFAVFLLLLAGTWLLYLKRRADTVRRRERH
jgi:hypothetical protein